MDTQAISANSVGKYFKVNGSNLQHHYKKHLSGYLDWDQLSHAEDWVLFEDNIGDHICIDEVALSKGVTIQRPNRFDSLHTSYVI